MKRLFSVFFVLVFVVSIIMIANTSVIASQSGDYTYTIVAGKATITAYTGAGGTITIPSTLGGAPVTNLGKDSFANSSTLTGVIIPGSVKSIDGTNYGGAFRSCSKLSSLTIGSGVTYIGQGAFEKCNLLTSVTIPDSVKTIASFAFNSCLGLTNLKLGKGITTLGGASFSQCSSLVSVSIPDSVLTIEGAFTICSKLETVYLGCSLMNIARAFVQCDALKRIVIPSSVRSIGDYSFMSCTALTDVTFLGDAPIMGKGIFTNCPANLKIWYLEGNDGFTNPWYGYPTQISIPLIPNPKPFTPSIKTVLNTSKTISGTGTLGGIAKITVGTKLYVENVIAGKWNLAIVSPLPAGTRVSVVIKKDGVSSSSNAVYVIPATPVVSKLKANAVYVKGTATKGATVYAKIGTKLYSAKASSSTGAYSIKISKIKKGTVVNVYCKAGGQFSAKKTVKAV